MCSGFVHLPVRPCQAKQNTPLPRRWQKLPAGRIADDRGGRRPARAADGSLQSHEFIRRERRRRESRASSAAAAGREQADLVAAVPEGVLELAVDVQSSQGPDAVRDADRAGEAPPLLVLHDEHEVPGAARADLVGPRVVLAGVVQIQRGLLLVDADVPRDEGRDLSK